MNNMNKFAAAIFLLLFYSFSFYAQNIQISDLQKSLKTADSDTTKANLMNQLSYQFQSIDPNKAMEYANAALAISENANFKSGSAYSYINIANI